MSYDFDQQDIELLKNAPHQLILNYQKLIDTVIHSFIRSRHFKFEELSDIKQQINEELLNRIPKIQNQFQGKSLLRTYITTIIRNICNEILRNRKKANYITLDEIVLKEINSEAMNALVVKEEVNRLQKVIGLYYKQKFKLILCLKLKFKIPFDLDDFRNVNRNVTENEFERFVQQVCPYQDSPDIKIFTALTEILNKYENKNNTPDALRKWIALKIDELIDILNGNPPISHYNEETLQILFEKCFCSQNEVMFKIY